MVAGATVAGALETPTGDAEPHDTMATAAALVMRVVSSRCMFMAIPLPAANALMLERACSDA
jgi:hypothetical protein